MTDRRGGGNGHGGGRRVGARGRRRPLGLAALLVAAALLGARAAAAQEQGGGLTLEVQIGLAGYWKEEGWTPVRVRATNRGPDLRGDLSALPSGWLGAAPRYTRAVELPRDSSKVFWLYVRLPGGTASLRVELTCAGSGVPGGVVETPVPTWPPGMALGLLGAAPTGRPALAAALDPLPNLVALAPGDLPDAWPGYDGLDVAVIRLTGQPVFAEEAGADAFADWLRAGGRAVVIAAGGGAGGEAASPLATMASLLPARPGAGTDLEQPAAVAEFAGATAPPAGIFPAARLAEVRGETLFAEEAVPLAVRGTCGLGEVTLLAFDPFAPPFDRWPGTPALWRRLLEGDRLREPRPEVLLIGGTPEQGRDLERITPQGARVRVVPPDVPERHPELIGGADFILLASDLEAPWVPNRFGGAHVPSVTLLLDGRRVHKVTRAPIDAPATVAEFAGVPPPEGHPFNVRVVGSGLGTAFLRTASTPLAVRNGARAFLLFDPWAPPFDRWAGRAAFWRRLYGELCTANTGQAREWQYSARHLAFESIFGRVRFGRLRLLLGTYVLLLWPVTWLLVRRRRRALWTWILLLLFAGAIGTAVYGFGMEGRPATAVLRQVSVLDLVGDGASGTGRTLACLFSPWGGRYEVSADDPTAFLHPVEASGPERGATLGPGAEECREELGTRLLGVQVPGGMVRQAEARWRGSADLGGTVLVTTGTDPTGEDWLTIDNRSDAPLQDLVLLAGNRYWESLPSVAPHDRASLTLVEPRRHFSPTPTPPSRPRFGSASNPDWAVAARPAAREIQEVSARADPVVDQWLCSGGKVLLAVTPRSVCPLLIDGRRLPTQELCVVRVFFR